MIKLFGRTIQLISNEDDKDMLFSHHNQLSSSTTTHETKILTQSNHGQSIGIKEIVEQTTEEPRTPNVDEETTIQELGGSSGISEDPETSTVDKETSSPDRNDKEDPNDMTSDSDEKTLIKPDKLIPCPRCSSMDTKFCYYNNYNVSQPRHFCKKCQRYWTAGGTMRNVPVGSGRRKNKCSPQSQFRQIIISEALQAARANGKLLGFGSDSSQSGSMASALIHAQKTENSVRSRGCFEEGNDPRIPFAYGAQEIGDDNSSGSSSTVISPNEKVLNIQESPLQVPCFPVPPWASPWNIHQWSSTMQQPAFGPPGFPISIYPPPPYWGCPAPNPWNTPWLYPQCPSSDLSVRSPDPDSQTLGKHSRDGSMISPSNPEKLELEEKDLKRRVLTPKALRIHDQSEAAQSSIWSTLGIKNEHTKSVNEASVHKAFCAKDVQKNHMMTKASMFLQANPAALQRSFNYQETA